MEINAVKRFVNEIVCEDFLSTQSFLINYVARQSFLSKSKQAFIVTGPISSGKSTIITNAIKLLNLFNYTLISTDIIYKVIFPNILNFEDQYSKGKEYTYKLLNELIQDGFPFIWEMVFAKNDKISQLLTIKSAGYKTCGIFVFVDNAKITINRTNAKKDDGEHFVSADKVERRYSETISNLTLFDANVDELIIIDNTITPKLMLHRDSVTKTIYINKSFNGRNDLLNKILIAHNGYNKIY